MRRIARVFRLILQKQRLFFSLLINQLPLRPVRRAHRPGRGFSGSVMAVRTSIASNPILSISDQGMVRVSSRPSRPNSRGLPSKSRLWICAVFSSSTKSSTRPRQAPSCSCTTSFSHSSRKVIFPTPLSAAGGSPPPWGNVCTKKLWYALPYPIAAKQMQLRLLWPDIFLAIFSKDEETQKKLVLSPADVLYWEKSP